MKKVFVVFGTRPEAIKMCPLVLELKKRKTLKVIVCVTGQHTDMLYSVLNFFKIKADYDLKIMKENQTLFDITTNVLNGIKEILEKVRPDIVLVHGDTTTSFSAALAAYYLNISVGHVEAGLRTYNCFSPYPEEFNRHAISLFSAYNFCPTTLNKEYLLNENVKERTIFVTGNTVIDSFKYTVTSGFKHPELEWARGSKLIFITAHRRENIGESMKNMFRGIKRVLDENPDVKAVYPIHKNPKVRAIANEIFDGCKNIHLIEPIDVFECHNFEKNCYLCLTDSGGLQEECPYFGKPVLVMRDTTERPEGINAGTVLLAGTSEESVYTNLDMLLKNASLYKKMSSAINPYGDGKASERIADILEKNV